MDLVLVLGLGLVAGTIAGVVGTGSSIILIPALVLQYGPQQAIPIMAVAALMANISRVLVWWREIDWAACAAYAVTGAPAAVLGARTLLVLPADIVDGVLGAFFLVMIPVRRWADRKALRLNRWHLAVAGAVIGYLTGIVASTGPLSVPVFLGYGLVKGAFLATEAAGSLAIFASKAVAFQQFGALPLDAVLKGLVVGTSLMIGALIAKRIVTRLDAGHFRILMDAVMLFAGLSLIWMAVARH
ncbi:sulfite exporter TauE/SafE family protein [Vineibacter terrae]|uniref:sulfite exporter TauE/SafE family protein n=1 Tax=Vineibacter terrae TaxID=2586908 RepID=UPI002E35C4ED|nr:sulfite exporter TauE/SafE family protein [Vineibacter terrae]HEX2888803.1 sulfite exporter TauE/SafE family protein [Vineibacter terrae]